MGGPMSVNDSLPWITQELDLIRSARAHELPVLGHCLGGQLMAKALGGTITKNPVREIGWLPVERYDNPDADDWLAGLPLSFEAFHWHGETFSLPQGAVPILKNQWCTHQAFVIDNMLAMQCHIEMTAEMVDAWTLENAHELTEPMDTVQSREQMLEDITAKIEDLQAIAKPIYKHWFNLLQR